MMATVTKRDDAAGTFATAADSEPVPGKMPDKADQDTTSY